MDLTDLPLLKPVVPNLAQQSEDDVTKFNHNRPEINLDTCSAPQLRQLLDWASQVKSALTDVLTHLETELRTETEQKDRALDELIAATTANKPSE